MLNEFLFKGNQLCIPDCSLRVKIIKELYGEGHIGHDRTLQIVSSSYYCPIMHRGVVRFIEQCRVYQLSKRNATNAGLYMPMPILT